MIKERLGNLLDAILFLVLAHVLIYRVHFFISLNAHAPMVMHLLGRRIPARLVHIQHPVTIGVFKFHLSRILRELFESQEIHEHRQGPFEVLALHMSC